MATRDEQYREILDAVHWRHRIRLDEERYTPGRKSRPRWDDFRLPEDMSGKSFLDVGASDGLYSFEAERRGADRVLAVDLWEERFDDERWEGFASKRTFDLAREYLDSDVNRQVIDVLNLSPETVGTFDVVLCSGVLQAIEDVTVAIRNIVSIANERVVVKNATSTATDGPLMELSTDTSERVWLPTVDCFERLLQRAGATDVEVFDLSNPRSDERLPDTWHGIVRNASTVYRNHDLTREAFTIKHGDTVQVLYETDDAYRVDYTGSPPPSNRQGWVPKDAVERDERKPDPLLDRAIRILQDEGLLALVQKAVRRLRGRGPTSPWNTKVFHARVPGGR
jgi:tRNA (mo5U34)-methyltransferase